MAAILLVEDDFNIRQALSQYLASAGYSIEAVATGMDGVMAATSDPYDVVVLDLGLPDMDGTQVLKMIRAVSTVPVIVATARDDEEEIVNVLKSGADDYVVKPFSGAQLEARIMAILRRIDSGGRLGSDHRWGVIGQPRQPFSNTRGHTARAHPQRVRPTCLFGNERRRRRLKA